MERKIRVLLVDDENRFCVTTSKLLVKKGFDTTIANTAEKALDILKKAPWDVIVLDIHMAGMDGLTALNQIKHVDPEIQVIMLTGQGSQYSAMRALVREAFDYLAKPCDVEILASRIQDAYVAKHQGVKFDAKKALNLTIPLEAFMTVLAEISLKEVMGKLAGVNQSLWEGAGKKELLLVRDARGILVGILTKMDVIRAVRPEYVSAGGSSHPESFRFSTIFWEGFFSDRVKEIAQKKVREIMSELPPVISENASLQEVAHLMCKEPQRLLLVQDISRVIGLIRAEELFCEISQVMQP